MICTHAHLENVGNLNLFPDATHFVGHDIMQAGKYVRHQFTLVRVTLPVVGTKVDSNFCTVVTCQNVMLQFQVVVTLSPQDRPFEIDDDLEVVASPGLVPSAVAVLVANSNLGPVAIAGLGTQSPLAGNCFACWIIPPPPQKKKKNQPKNQSASCRNNHYQPFVVINWFMLFKMGHPCWWPFPCLVQQDKRGCVPGHP